MPVKMESLNISRNFKFKILRREKKMMVPHALLVKFWEGNWLSEHLAMAWQIFS